MKRILAIGMLLALMFNMGGYMLLFNYFISQSDEFANEQISKGLYKPDELVEIKIPIQLPYITERQYESISGQIQLDGHNYNYVALKITSDTMYVKCVPNYEKTRLLSENIITATDVSDLPLQKKNHAPLEKKSGLDNEYFPEGMLYHPVLNRNLLKSNYFYTTKQTLRIFLGFPAQPPEQLISA